MIEQTPRTIDQSVSLTAYLNSLKGKMDRFLIKNKIINKFQSGFRKNRQTLDNLTLSGICQSSKNREPEK